MLIPRRVRVTARYRLVGGCAAVAVAGCGGPSKPAQSEAERVQQPGTPPAEQAAAPPNVDSAAAARIARTFVTGLLDTANIEILSYEWTDSGHVFAVSRRLPEGMAQLDGGCTVLIDPKTKRPRILGPRVDRKCSP